MASDLKPCPFCGGEAYIACFTNMDLNDFWIYRCKKCGVSTRGHARKSGATKAWNRRAKEKLLQQAEEATREARDRANEALRTVNKWQFRTR